MASGFIEIANRSINPMFSNVANDDFAIYTSTSNQTIHLGTQSNASSMFRINKSNNIEVSGDVVFPTVVSTQGIHITKKSTDAQRIVTLPTGALQNTSSLATGASNVVFSLLPGQSNSTFVNSNNTQMLSVSSGLSNLVIGGKFSSSNFGYRVIQVYPANQVNWNNITSAAFTVGNGLKLLMITCSLYTGTGGGNTITYTIKDSVTLATRTSGSFIFFFNQASTHRSVARDFVISGSTLPAGTYTFNMATSPAITNVDDYVSVTIVEFPV